METGPLAGRRNQTRHFERANRLAQLLGIALVLWNWTWRNRGDAAAEFIAGSAFRDGHWPTVPRSRYHAENAL
jgi:hypothetical protein